MRVLVCGGRDYRNATVVLRTLQVIDITTLIEGCADGADRLAEGYAKLNGIPNDHYPADWRRDGKAAGPIRNRLMLDDGKPELVVAFPGGRGTANMIELAERAGVPVQRVNK